SAVSEIENRILDILDSNPQGLDHEKLVRQVRGQCGVQLSTINIAISSLERAGRISKGGGVRFTVVRDVKLVEESASREELVLRALDAEPLMTVADIATELGIDTSSAGALVKRMVSKGAIVDSGQTQPVSGAGRRPVLYMLPSLIKSSAATNTVLNDIPKFG